MGFFSLVWIYAKRGTPTSLSQASTPFGERSQQEAQQAVQQDKPSAWIPLIIPQKCGRWTELRQWTIGQCAKRESSAGPVHALSSGIYGMFAIMRNRLWRLKSRKVQSRFGYKRKEKNLLRSDNLKNFSACNVHTRRMATLLVPLEFVLAISFRNIQYVQKHSIRTWNFFCRDVYEISFWWIMKDDCLRYLSSLLSVVEVAWKLASGMSIAACQTGN